MTPSSSFLVTDSIPEAEATNIEETDSCLVTDCDHDDDDNDHDDSFLAQEALHYEETILETLLIERSESILKVESKPEDRGRYYTMVIDCFHQQRTTLNHQSFGIDVVEAWNKRQYYVRSYMSLKGDFLDWYNFEMERRPFSDWFESKRRLCARFGRVKSTAYEVGHCWMGIDDVALAVGSRLESVGFYYELLSQLVYEPSIKGSINWCGEPFDRCDGDGELGSLNATVTVSSIRRNGEDGS
ncbi:hypothetical protein F2Q70_00038126 [Brassica cretica]|uniref:Uncharacterized protein n=1 Tax=Brassica cretica TaxID=69181 RepID=A0A8S9K8P5_BRACR|nr:hypothetical protein F2Q70_00038126 [Brassica cretica]